MREQAAAIGQSGKARISMLLPNLCGGGAERASVNMANSLAGRGVPVEMVLLSARGEFLDELDPRVRVFDLGVDRFRTLLPKLVGYLRSNTPDVLIANMWPLTGVAVLARWLARVVTRVVVVEHINWSASHHAGSLATRLGMRWLFPRAHQIVAVSQGVADDLATFARLDRHRIRVIYNAIVDAAQAVPGAGDLDCADWLTGPHRKIIAIGSFKAQKNFPLLLEAFARLVEGVDARLLVLGEGPGRPQLEQRIAQLGLAGLVFLPGFSRVPGFYLSRADLFVLSSDFEGFGNVIVEALHAGVPVVSTRCPSGPDEILEDGRLGKLVPVGDAGALAAAMRRSLQEPPVRSALVERAAFFSIDRSVDEYLTVVDQP